MGQLQAWQDINETKQRAGRLAYGGTYACACRCVPNKFRAQTSCLRSVVAAHLQCKVGTL